MSLDVEPPAGSPPEISLRDLTKHFGEVRAVDDVSLEIGGGEFFSLLGPSGCGKTTTLRMIGGFDLPTSGVVELRGRDVTRDPPDKRPVNMVFQSYALFPHLDVAGNIAFGLKRRGMAGEEIKRRTGAILERVHLAGYERRRPHELSGGQQQRVALARALVNEPQVLLLDEPLGALDLKLRKQLQVELKRIQMDVGITFVYVTHDQEEALTMSDRIAVMHRGRIEQVGTPGGPLRPPGDVVRRRLHRHDEPARRAPSRARRTALPTSGSSPATSVSWHRQAGEPVSSSSSASGRSRSHSPRCRTAPKVQADCTEPLIRWRILAPRFCTTFALMEASFCRFSQAERVRDSNPVRPWS